jgi:hypothetical protein
MQTKVALPGCGLLHPDCWLDEEEGNATLLVNGQGWQHGSVDLNVLPCHELWHPFTQTCGPRMPVGC